MRKPRRYGVSTRSIHTDIRYLKPDAHAMPVFDTTAYTYKSLADADKPEYSFKYARIATPNGEVLEKTLCSLEEGEAALVVADGMRAISLAISSMITPGKRGTYSLHHSGLLRHLRLPYQRSTRVWQGMFLSA